MAANVCFETAPGLIKARVHCYRQKCNASNIMDWYGCSKIGLWHAHAQVLNVISWSTLRTLQPACVSCNQSCAYEAKGTDKETQASITVTFNIIYVRSGSIAQDTIFTTMNSKPAKQNYTFFSLWSKLYWNSLISVTHIAQTWCKMTQLLLL